MNENIEHKIRIFVILLVMGSLSSCSWSDPVRVEDDFGNSVRHMIEQQKQAQSEEETSSDYKPTELDGDSALNSLEQYRAAQKRTNQKDSLDSFGVD